MGTSSISVVKRERKVKCRANLGENTSYWVVRVVARVPSTSVVVEISGRECASFEGDLRITADRGDLTSEFERCSLVQNGGVRRGRILMLHEHDASAISTRRRSERTNLDECLDFLVLRSLRARNARESDLAGISLEGSEDQCSGHSVDVALGFGVRESLIGSRLLEAAQCESARVRRRER